MTRVFILVLVCTCINTNILWKITGLEWMKDECTFIQIENRFGPYQGTGFL